MKRTNHGLTICLPGVAAAMLAVAHFACLPVPARAAGAERPNVILVLTDDQGYGDLSCHGNPVLKTPYLDRLYQQSIRLVDFHVAPMCTPTRAELMTGRDALVTGAYCVCSGRTFIRRSMPTMAEVFRQSGYRTGVFGKWHLGDNYPHRPQDRGFEEAVCHLGWGITSTPDYWNNDYFDDTFRHNGQVKHYPGYCTDVWFAEATRWIESCRTRGEPFFAYISTNTPHGPFFAPEEYRDPYKDLDRDTAGFFAMIANIDDNMARLDAILEKTGLRENTLLIFMTDNGGTRGIKVYNAGMRGAKASLYEGGHRVPDALGFQHDPSRLGGREPGLPDLARLAGSHAGDRRPDGRRAAVGPRARGRGLPAAGATHARAELPVERPGRTVRSVRDLTSPLASGS